ncbi:unnamed protein product [Oppiella nova]|uniref:Magnesium-dependent phosphatase 1 n=1 Tax=Oppiella nova TaxID=334625 RepID=A0A7R9LYD8_9ACAR|nr:unnamed protein product [Oppiella nova]CAG2168196.1 unnamed protein product [Oppiella nova]
MDYLQNKVNHLKIIIFDLDFTLWPFYVEDYKTGLPFHTDINGLHIARVDTSGRPLDGYYPEVPVILQTLSALGYTLAVASRTPWAEGAQQLLKLYDWDKYFTYKQMYPGSKLAHFDKIRRQSGAKLSEMLFFDDEIRNIKDLRGVGVHSVLVTDGIDKCVVMDAIKAFVAERELLVQEN